MNFCEHELHPKRPGFLGFSLYLWKFREKQNLTLGNFVRLCYTPWKFKCSKTRLMEIPYDSFILLLFKLTPGIYTCSFWKFHVFNPPCLDFSGIAQWRPNKFWDQSPPSMILFASIWDSFLVQALVLLLFQYLATSSRGKGPDLILQSRPFQNFHKSFQELT